MKHLKEILVCTIALSLILLLATGTSYAMVFNCERVELADNYTYQYRGYRAYDINDAGVIVGDIHRGPGYHNSFVRDGNQFTEFTDDDRDLGRAINNNGDILFNTVYYSGRMRGMLEKSNGDRIHFASNTPGGALSNIPSGVNDQQTVAGYYPVSNSVRVGYTYDTAYHQLITPPSTTNFYVQDINNAGQIVGWDGKNSGIFYQDGQSVFIQRANADSTILYAINDSGMAAGYYRKNGIDTGFVYDLSTETFFDVFFPGSSGTRVYGLNNLGQVVGGYTINGRNYGFLGNPTSNLNNGLIAYYPFNGNADDESGNGYNGSPIGNISYTGGNLGQAAILQGGNGYIDLPTYTEFSNTFSTSVALWIKQDEQDVLISDKPTPNIFEGWEGTEFIGLGYEYFNGSPHYSWIGAGEPGYYLVGSYHPHYNNSEDYVYGERHLFHKANLSDGNWHLIVATYDNDSLTGKLYLDGVEVNSVNFSDVNTAYGGPTHHFSQIDYSVGYYSTRDGSYAGAVDELRIYDRALTVDEIQALFSIIPENIAPVANAGVDQTIIEIGTNIVLDATQSYDPNDDAINYSWAFISMPIGSSATFTDSTSANPTFTADVHGVYEIELTVIDTIGSSNTDTVVVDFQNIIPVADAGSDQSAIEDDIINLDGSNSNDENLDILSFNWNLVGWPSGSETTINDVNAGMPNFVADLPGQYEVCLIVNDGFVDSVPDCILINVKSYHEAAENSLQETITIVENLGLKTASIEQINAVLVKIEAGEYQGALNQLESGILNKVNGCIETGSPDKNDWDPDKNDWDMGKKPVIDCEDQREIYFAIVESINFLKKALGISESGAVIFTIDGLDFEKIFDKGQQPDFRPSYLKEALLSTSLSAYDLYAFGLDCYDSECDFSWSGDANYSEEYIGYLIDQIKYYSDLAKSSNKKFILVTHSWGTVLGTFALGYLKDNYDVVPDLFITLSTPLASTNNQENLEDTFWEYSANWSIFEPFEWLVNLIPSNTELNSVRSWQKAIGVYIILECSDMQKQLAFEMPYLTFTFPKPKRWINYWAMGDIFSGEMNTGIKNSLPTESGDSIVVSKKKSTIEDRKIDFSWTNRNFENTKLWHSITSLNEMKWEENGLSDTHKALAVEFREKVINEIKSVIDE